VPDLFSYRQQVSRLIGDVKNETFNPFDLDIYINLARSQVAAEGQCVRRLLPISNGIAAVTAVTVGINYTNAIVSVGPPDLPGTQAVVTANIVGNAISSYNVVTAGSGYMFPPHITVSGNGTGATASSTLLYTSRALLEQEIYPFSAVPITALFAGVSRILAVLSVAIIWQNIRYVGNRLSFSKYQALVRSYTAGNFLYTPFWFSQYGQGDDGSFYIYPLPDQTYPMEWDCLCLPLDLVPDGSVSEVVPYPWTDAVPFYAAWLALLASGDPVRMNFADKYFRENGGGLYSIMMRRARAYAQPQIVSSWYGRMLQ